MVHSFLCCEITLFSVHSMLCVQIGNVTQCLCDRSRNLLSRHLKPVLLFMFLKVKQVCQEHWLSILTPLICKTFTSCWFITFGIFLNWSLVKLNLRKTCGLQSSLSVFYRTCIYVTEPTRRDIGSSLRAIYQQMQRKKNKNTAHVLVSWS